MIRMRQGVILFKSGLELGNFPRASCRPASPGLHVSELAQCCSGVEMLCPFTHPHTCQEQEQTNKQKKQNKTKQNKTKQTKQNKTKQNKTKQNKTNKTKQNKTKQNKTKQNKTKQNKTKQNKTKQNKQQGV